MTKRFFQWAIYMGDGLFLSRRRPDPEDKAYHPRKKRQRVLYDEAELWPDCAKSAATRVAKQNAPGTLRKIWLEIDD